MYTELFNPIHGTVRGLPVIVLGAVSSTQVVGDTSQTVTQWVVTDDDGKVRTVEMDEVVVDVRFRDGKWHDTSPDTEDIDE